MERYTLLIVSLAFIGAQGSCPMGSKSLGFSQKPTYPRIKSIASSVTTDVTQLAKMADSFRLDLRDRGACLYDEKMWTVDFSRQVNVYSILVQGTQEGSLTHVKFQYTTGADWLDLGAEVNVNLVDSSDVYEYKMSAIDAANPVIAMTKLRVIPSQKTNDGPFCLRLDVHECPDDVLAASKCDKGHKSVGLEKMSVKPRVDNDKVTNHKYDKSSDYSGERIRLDDRDTGACLLGGATGFKLKFDKNVPVYKLVFQGTKNAVKGVNVKYSVQGSAEKKNDRGLTDMIDLSGLTTFSMLTKMLDSITEMNELFITLEGTNEPKCLRMAVYTCPLGTNLEQCDAAPEKVTPEVTLENAAQSLDAQWDEAANAARLHLHDYRGGCLGADEYIDVIFRGTNTITGIVIQGALDDNQFGKLSKFEVLKVIAEPPESVEQVDVQLSSMASTKTHHFTNSFTTNKVRIKALEWANKAGGVSKTCFRFDFLGCTGCETPLGLNKNDPLIGDYQISTDKPDITGLFNVRLNSNGGGGFCLEANQYVAVDFFTSVKISGFTFQETTTDNADTALKILKEDPSGNDDSIPDPLLLGNKEKTVMLTSPILRKQLKLSSTKKVCLKFEVLGCYPESPGYGCEGTSTVGIEYAKPLMPVKWFTLSTGGTVTDSVRLNDETKNDNGKIQGVCVDPDDFLELDLHYYYKLSSLIIQVAGDNDSQYLSSFQFEYHSLGDWLVWEQTAGQTQVTLDWTLAPKTDEKTTMLNGLIAKKVRIRSKAAEQKCFRLDLTGCRLMFPYKEEVKVRAGYSLSGGAKIATPDKCLPGYKETISKLHVEKYVTDVCQILFPAKVDVDVSVKLGNEKLVYVEFEFEIKAMQRARACARRITDWLSTTTLLNGQLSADDCDPIEKTSEFVAQEVELKCSNDDDKLRYRTNTALICDPGSYFTCEDSGFVDVPEQVKGYELSFADNMLKTDTAVYAASADQCHHLAYQNKYSSYYYKSASPDVKNCFLTHVMVNYDYNFVDKDLMTNAAVPKIKQRQCIYETHHLSYMHQTLLASYAGTFDFCLADNLDDGLKTKIKQMAEDDLKKQIYLHAHECFEFGASMKLSKFELDVTFTEDAANSGQGNLKASITAIVTVSPMMPLTTDGNLQQCMTAILSLKPPALVVEEDCDGSAEESVTSLMITLGDLIRSCNEDPSERTTGDEYYLGPVDAYCYRRKFDGFETLSGFCPAPGECNTIHESIFACSLKCLSQDNCYGYNYDTKNKFCQMLRQPCAGVTQHADFLFFKRTEGLCNTLINTDIKCIHEYIVTLQHTLTGDYKALYEFCSEERISSVNQCFDRAKMTCNEEEFSRFSETRIHVDRYRQGVCVGYFVTPGHVVPAPGAGGCDLNVKDTVTAALFATLDKTTLQGLCDQYAATVRDVMKAAAAAADAAACSDIQQFLIYVRLELYQNLYLTVCKPSIPDNGDRTHEYCSVTDFRECQAKLSLMTRKSFFQDEDWNVDDYCSEISSVKECVNEQMAECDDTDKLIGVAYQKKYEYLYGKLCEAAALSCNQEIAFFYEELKTIVREFYSGKNKDSPWCTTEKWSAYLAEKITQKLEATKCSDELKAELNAIVTAAVAIKDEICKQDLIPEAEESDDCKEGLKAAMKCASAVTRGLILAKLAGAPGQAALCLFHFKSTMCLFKHTKKCSGNTMKRFLVINDFTWKITGEKCVYMQPASCTTNTDAFDAMYSKYSVTVKDVKLALKDRCAAYNAMYVKLKEEINLKSCLQYYQFKRVAEFAILTDMVGPLCSKCGNSESVSCIHQFFWSQSDRSVSPAQFCRAEKKVELEACIKKVEEVCEGKARTRIQALAQVTLKGYDMYCAVKPAKQRMVPYCVYKDRKCDGGDISTDQVVTNVLECADKCKEDSKCVAFQYKDKKCTTKSLVCTKLAEDANTFYYYKTTDLDKECALPRFCTYPSRTCSGNDLSSHDVQNVHECRSGCVYTTGCKAFVLDTANKKCMLKSAVCAEESLTENKDMVYEFLLGEDEKCGKHDDGKGEYTLKKFCANKDHECKEHTIGDFSTGLSVYECLDKCAGTDGCAGVQYDMEKDKADTGLGENIYNRCYLKSQVCEELKDAKDKIFLKAVDYNEACPKDSGCNEVEAKKCASKAVLHLFLYLATDNEAYHRMLCMSMVSVKKCVLENSKTCKPLVKMNYIKIITRVKYALRDVCHWPKPPEKCKEESSMTCLMNMVAGLPKYMKANGIWDMDGMCGSLSEPLQCIGDNVRSCEEEDTGRMYMTGISLYIKQYTNRFCQTLRTVDCKSSAAFACIRTFVQKVEELQISVTPTEQVICTDTSVEDTRKCLLTASVICPDSIVYLKKLFQVAVRSVTTLCQKPVCRSVLLADIVFVVDESGSVKKENFVKQRDFLEHTVEQLDGIGLDGVQVAIVEYSSRVNEVFKLHKSSSKEKVLDYVKKMKYKKGSTRTHAALNYVRRTIFKKARPGVPRLVIVLTDGKSQSPRSTINSGQKLISDLGAKIFVIGIGPNVYMEEVEGMSSGKDDYVFNPDSFDAMTALVPRIVSKLFCVGVGATNPYVVTDGASCQVSVAGQCVSEWLTEVMNVFAGFTADTQQIVAVCRKITDRTECVTNALVECTGPTRFRYASSLWQMREKIVTVCSALIKEPIWGEYGPTCDGEFRGAKKCIKDLELTIGRTASADYSTLCPKMKKTISCVFEAVIGCPKLEQFYWKAYLEFVYYPLMKAGACTKPQVDDKVTGELCGQSQASVKIKKFNQLTLTAIISGDFKAVCAFLKESETTMTASMPQCTDKQNKENSKRFTEIRGSLADSCKAVVAGEDPGCDMTKLSACVTEFEAGWTVHQTALDEEADGSTAKACAYIQTTLQCITESTTSCPAAKQPMVERIVSLFMAKWKDAVVCTEVTYVPTKNDNCLLTQAQAVLDKFSLAANAGDGSTACGMVKLTKSRLDAMLLDCPQEKIRTLLLTFTQLTQKLSTTCTQHSECKTDNTRLTINPGESKKVYVWFEGNPFNKYCKNVENCEIRVRYGLETKKGDAVCRRRKQKNYYKAQGMFESGAGGSCALLITRENYNKKQAITVRHMWYRKRMKNQKRKLSIYVQIIEGGKVKEEQACSELQVTFVRESRETKVFKRCQVWGDPHFIGYQKTKYNCYANDFFTLLTYENKPINIQGYFSKCNPGWPHTCLTIATIQAGGYVFTFDRAARNKAPKKNCRRGRCGKKKRASGTTVSVIKNGDLLPGTRVYYRRSKKRFYFMFPNGLEIILREIYGAFDMDIVITAEEFGKIHGLCGTPVYPGEGAGFVMKGGEVYDPRKMDKADRPQAFIKSWTVEEGSVMMYGQYAAWKAGRKTMYCECGLDQTADHLCGDYMGADSCYKMDDQRYKDMTDKFLKVAVDVNDEEQTAQRRRKKRAIVQDPLPRNPPPATVPTFPLADGTTRAMAVKACETRRDDFPVLVTCAADPYNVDVQGFVDTCVTDIELGVSIEEATDMNIQSALAACQSAADAQPDPADPSAANPAEDLSQAIDNLLCPNFCSKQGTCVNGTCNCNPGWGNADCSLNTTAPPDVTTVGVDGACNPASTNCANVVLSADNINEAATPKCKLQELSIVGKTSSNVGAEYVVDAVVLSATQISCPSKKATHHEVSISNDGATYGGVYLHLVYNPACTSCDASGAEPVCTQTANTCLVGGTCYADKETLPGDTCLFCDVTASKTTFQIRKTQPCYEKHGMSFTPEGLEQTDIIIIGAVVGLVLIGALVFVIFKYFVKPRTPKTGGNGGNDRNPIHREQPETKYTFDGPNEQA